MPLHDTVLQQAIRTQKVTQWSQHQLEWTIITFDNGKQDTNYFVTAQFIRTKNDFITQHLDTLLDSLPCAIFWKNTQLEYLGCNQFYAELIGLNHKQQIIGKQEKDLHWHTPENARAIEQCERDLLHSRQLRINIKESYTLQDNRHVSLYSSKIPLFDSKYSMTTGLLGIYVDTTQVEQDKNRIEQLSVELQTIIDNVPCAVFWKDTDSRFLGCNMHFAKFAALLPKDIIGKTDYELPWSKEESDNYRQDDQQVMESKQAKLDIEEPQTTPDGKRILLSTSKVPLIDGNDQVIGVLCVYTDITERKEAQDTATKLLLEQEKAKVFKLLSSSIAHELRTPLASIYHANGAMEKVFPALLDSYQKASLAQLPLTRIAPNRLALFANVVRRIESEIKTCNTFIDMTLAKLRYERIIINELIPISIVDAVQEAIDLYEGRPTFVQKDPFLWMIVLFLHINSSCS